MLIELISNNNYASYNVKIAKIIGLHASIYLQELLNINQKAIQKAKLEDGYFILDRNYIEERTTFDEKEQKQLEDILIEIGIVLRDEKNKDMLSVDIQMLASIMMSDDESILSNIKQIVKSKKPKATKSQKILENLKQNITVTNRELYDAYSEWVDAVYSKQGWMSKRAIISAQEIIDEVSNRNLDIALQIIRIATINGYRDMSWAVNTYKKDFSVSYRITSQTTAELPNEPVRLSEEVF